MNKNSYKFILLFLFHFFFIIITFYGIIRFLFQENENHFILLLFHSLFCILYYFFMWKDLYSLDYHSFLQSRTIKTIIKNITLSVFIIYFIILISSTVYIFFSDNPETRIPLKEISVLMIIDIGLYIILHVFQYLWISLLIHQGFLKKNIIIVGKPDSRLPFAEFMHEMEKTKTIVGKITTDGKTWYFDDLHDNVQNYEIDELKDTITSHIVGEMIFFIDKDLCGEKLYELVSYCRKNSINYYVIPEIEKLPDQGFWKKRFIYIPLVEKWVSARDSLILISCKRLFDLLLVLLATIVLLPVCLLIACAIKLDNNGPVLYISNRVGKNGKIMKFIKFRTMVVNAEDLKKDLLPRNQRRDGPLFKMQNDPRITRIGRILRKFSLDEIPQLINVLKGELSLIGPRPHLATEVMEYSKKDKLRLECFPGVIGLPQMYGDNFSGFREIVDLDLFYRKNWSLPLDMKILAMGFKVIVFPFLSKDK
ncbi:MAG: sugar transferase [Spirochaetales bacterium]|nr:sugar transferase [Spirochaetales bacterium]